MPENRVDFRYTVGDVASAQRTRFVKSPQFKTMLIFWVGTVLFMALHVILPDTVRIIQGVNWPVVISISLVYLATLFVLVFVTPFFDFMFNRFWHLPLSLHFSDKLLSLKVDVQRKKPAVSKGSGKGGKKVSARSGSKTSDKTGNKPDEKPKKKSASLDLAWDEIKQAHVNKRAYIIYYGPQARFFVVPRSAFKPEQEQYFRELLGDKLKL